MTTTTNGPGSLADRLAAAQPRWTAAGAALARVRIPSAPRIVRADDVVDDAVNALLAGADLPDDAVDRVADSASAHSRYLARRDVVFRVRARLEAEHVAAGREEAEAALSVVRAELAELVTQARALFAGPLARVHDPGEAIRAGAVEPWERVLALAALYRAARGAQEAIVLRALVGADVIGAVPVKSPGENRKAVKELVKLRGHVRPTLAHRRYRFAWVDGREPVLPPWATGDDLADLRYVATAGERWWCPTVAVLQDAEATMERAAAEADAARREEARVRDLGGVPS